MVYPLTIRPIVARAISCADFVRIMTSLWNDSYLRIALRVKKFPDR